MSVISGIDPAASPPLDILSGYLTREALAPRLGVGPRTLQNWEVARVGPKVTKVGRIPYYAIDDVREWLAAGGIKARQRKRPLVRRPARVTAQPPSKRRPRAQQGAQESADA
jgi:hypothetical protein